MTDMIPLIYLRVIYHGNYMQVNQLLINGVTGPHIYYLLVFTHQQNNQPILSCWIL